MVSHSARTGRDRSVVIQLGTEPPLRSGEEAPLLDPRALSVRWLAGTILTAVAGSFLMGGAIYSAFDGQTQIADLPRFATVSRVIESASNANRKGDRIAPNAQPVGARSTIRVSATTRVGNREVVKVRPYTRVTAALASRPTTFASQVPDFNPTKLMSEADGTVTAEPDSDGDLTMVTRDLNALGPIDANDGLVVPVREVLAKVRETAAFESAKRFTEFASNMTPTDESPQVTSYAPAAAGPELPGFELDKPLQGRRPLLKPANETNLAKTAALTGVKANGNELVVSVGRDSSIAAVLQENGAPPDEARAIAEAFSGSDGYGIGQATAGQQIRILFDPPNPAKPKLTVARVSVFSEETHLGSVAASDTGGFVSVADLGDEDEAEEDNDRRNNRGRGLRLYNSIYETALAQQVPTNVIQQFTRIVSFDVDFSRRVSSGDSLELFYADDDDSAQPELLFAQLNVGGEQKRFYRYQTNDDGIVDWYDEEGRSAKKFLMRKPLNGGSMRSGYGARRHPILGYTKMHTGVDWANPSGTPIMAAGNGTIEKAGWEGGYGKYIRLQHSNGYETGYGHLSAFARGIKPGVRVRQGQIIGFVGSTGLSTGPHVHYEVLINNRFVNPMRIKLPRGRELDGQTLTAFSRERERIDGLLSRSGSTTASLGTQQGG